MWLEMNRHRCVTEAHPRRSKRHLVFCGGVATAGAALGSCVLLASPCAVGLTCCIFNALPCKGEPLYIKYFQGNKTINSRV